MSTFAWKSLKSPFISLTLNFHFFFFFAWKETACKHWILSLLNIGKAINIHFSYIQNWGQEYFFRKLYLLLLLAQSHFGVKIIKTILLGLILIFFLKYTFLIIHLLYKFKKYAPFCSYVTLLPPFPSPLLDLFMIPKKALPPTLGMTNFHNL